MIGIVVLSHGPLAEALVTTALGLVGPQSDVSALGLGVGEAPDSLATRLGAIAEPHSAALLLLCDLRGGSPHQVAADCAARLGLGRVAVLTGVNLGMLCEALLSRERATSVQELAERLARVGVEQVACLGGADAIAP